MKFKLCIFILFVSNILLAQDTLDVLNASLIGKWNWNKTAFVYRGGGGIEDSSMCHCTRYIIFRSDNTIEFYENNKLKSWSAYSLRKSYFMNDPVKIMFSSDFLHGELIFENKILGIGAFGNCGAESYYSKED